MSKRKKTGVAGRMTVAASAVAAKVARLAFRVFNKFPEEKRIVLLSRQSPKPLDFTLLEPALKDTFPKHDIEWACVKKSGKLTIPVALKQTWLSATSELVIADSYIPSISVCAGMHRGKCVQMWHALGAIKKFGHQSLDTPAGRPAKIADRLQMHAGYDLVVAGLPGAVESFSEAFDYPKEKIEALGLPRIGYMLNRLAIPELFDTEADVTYLPKVLQKLQKLRQEGKKVVLYAPTFRRNADAGDHWIANEIVSLRKALDDPNIVLAVARHPLENLKGEEGENDGVIYLGKVRSMDALCCVDAVITDYSAVAFEAWISSVPIVFYVPDIEEYRISPGLNIDPVVEFPHASFTNATQAGNAINEVLADNLASQEEVDAFMEDYVGELVEDAAYAIAGRLEELLGEKEFAVNPSDVDNDINDNETQTKDIADIGSTASA